VVPRGQRVQLVFAADTTEAPVFTDVTASVENAIQMAVERHPTLRGFPISISSVETTCLTTDNTLSANAIVADTQNVAVLGNLCSGGLATALPIYQAAGIVAISGSATASSLPQLGPSVFDRTAVASDAQGDAGDRWLTRVAALPAVLEWARAYRSEFGSDPYLQPFPALYYDATRLLIARLQRVSAVVDGNLVINRAALASAVRYTSDFPGVTCTITLDPATGNRINDSAALNRCAER
jgi:ABC-type branched-subunit amino acid transport system substrate-binding protein